MYHYLDRADDIRNVYIYTYRNTKTISEGEQQWRGLEGGKGGLVLGWKVNKYELFRRSFKSKASQLLYR